MIPPPAWKERVEINKEDDVLFYLLKIGLAAQKRRDKKVVE